MKSRFHLKYSDFEHTPEGRKVYNEGLFREVAPKYALITRLLSFNRDRVWKQRMVALLEREPVNHCLDLACGDGDITLLLQKLYPNARITGLDLCQEMLQLARQRRGQYHIDWRIGDMCRLEIPDESVDVVTGGYALRNAPDVESAIQEIRRVLRPGGQAVFLEFAKPDNPVRQSLNHWILRIWGNLWGWLLHGRGEIYAYIAKSLQHFPERQKFHTMFVSAGMRIVYYESRFFGLLEITLVEKNSM